MTSLQPSFMQPPNFLLPPQGQIKPGVVLRDRRNGMRGPSLPLRYRLDSAKELEVTVKGKRGSGGGGGVHGGYERKRAGVCWTKCEEDTARIFYTLRYHL